MKALKADLVRAVCDWALEQGFTPHVAVYATYPGVQVPDRFVQDGRVVLNVHPQAVTRYLLNDDGLSFSARFGGVPQSVTIPLPAILAVYAHENGQGISFPEPDSPQDSPQPSQGDAPPRSVRPVLRSVK
ncbi:MAG: ClpXP protease specificity-enhancing factor SspB [Pseudomonadota bacterium]